MARIRNHCYLTKILFNFLTIKRNCDEDGLFISENNHHTESQGFTLKKNIFNVHANYFDDEITEGFVICIYAESDPIRIYYLVDEEEKYKQDYEFIKNWVLNVQ